MRYIKPQRNTMIKVHLTEYVYTTRKTSTLENVLAVITGLIVVICLIILPSLI